MPTTSSCNERHDPSVERASIDDLGFHHRCFISIFYCLQAKQTVRKAERKERRMWKRERCAQVLTRDSEFAPENQDGFRTRDARSTGSRACHSIFSELCLRMRKPSSAIFDPSIFAFLPGVEQLSLLTYLCFSSFSNYFVFISRIPHGLPQGRDALHRSVTY